MRRLLSSHTAASAALFALLACGGDGGGSPAGTLSGTSFCERATSLATLIGCSTPLDGCQEPAAAECVAHGNNWLDCAATDRRQCLCESDGDLNCEGSFKDNEGPALCVQEMSLFRACMGD